jgi:hypothetical protein
MVEKDKEIDIVALNDQTKEFYLQSVNGRVS